MTRPSPRQVGHGVTMTSPRPPHRGHGDVVTICPSRLWRTRWTWPLPLHSTHVTGFVPLPAPLPSQSAQRCGRRSVTGTVAPNTACSNEIVATASMSWPRGGPLGPRRAPPPNPPPNSELNRSPTPPEKMSSNVAPPPAAPDTPASPKRS